MDVFVAGVSSERQYVASLRTFENLSIRAGDLKPPPLTTRGDVARISLCRKFLDSDCDALLLLDLDMLIPEDALEKMREHDLPIVTGHYYKRKTSPMESIVSTSIDGSWPYLPVFDPPREGLHREIDGNPIVLTGFGCCLIQREVIEAVEARIDPREQVLALGPIPEMTDGENGHFGSDFRFLWHARQLGYDVWLDADVECLHGTTIWLSHYLNDKIRERDSEHILFRSVREKSMELNGLSKQTFAARIKELESKREQIEDTGEEVTVDKAMFQRAVLSGQIAENKEFMNTPELQKIGKVKVFEDQDEVMEALKKE